MSSLRFKLPPLNSLVAFEASARHLSFTRAGEELRVSREAVSRQVRSLESYLGQALFIRMHRALALTTSGKVLSASVGSSLTNIADTTAELLRSTAVSSVKVSASVAIASFWLTPRLPHFRAENPHTTIHVTVTDTPSDMQQSGINIGLRYGDGNWPGIVSTWLFDVESIPVCSIGYLENAPLLLNSGDLCHHTLLNLDGPSHELEDWTWWFSSFGVPKPGPGQIIGFDNYANVIQAALNGQGLALGFTHLVDDMIEDGTLVAPIRDRRGRGLGVYLVLPENTPMTEETREFYEWILYEAK